MKFIVASSVLLRQLQAISGVISTNNPLPILDNFLLEVGANKLTITASDLETTIVTEIEAESKDHGTIAIPARMLLDTLKSFGSDEPLTFTINEKGYLVEISSSQGKYKISGQNGEEFPRIPENDGTNSLDIPSDVLLNAISKTLFATGNDDLRPVMSGVYCQLSPENVTFVATDAHRLVRYRRIDAKANKEISFIIPKKPLNLLKNTLPTDSTVVNIEYNDSNAFFTFGGHKVICRLIDGRYPNYEAVIPADNPNVLEIDREQFLNSIKRVAIFSNKTTHQVKLKISGSEIQISAEDVDFNNEAKEKLTCNYHGDDMEIAFNAKFIADMLSNINSEQVKMEMSLPNRAGIITPSSGESSDENLLMLVMPVMLG